jgi:hypothetical protein
LALYTLSFSGLPDNPDAEVEFQTTRSLVREQRMALGDTPEARAIIAANFDIAPGVGARAGRWYSWFGLGQALAAVPLFVLGDGLQALFPQVEQRHRQTQAYGAARSEYWQHLSVGWRNPLCAAAIAALLLIIARRLGATRRSALLAALLFGTASFAWPQARSSLSDVQATFFLLLALERWLAWRAASRGDHFALFGVGVALSASVLTRVALAPAALCLALVAAAELRFHRAALRAWCALFTPLGLGAALFLIANQLRFDSPWESGYGAALAGGSFFSYPPHLGLAGVLLAPGKGLVWMAPLLLLAPLGLRQAYQSPQRAWCVLSLAVALCVLAPIVFTQTWHGAWTYGPRYLLPMVACLWPALALCLDVARKWTKLAVTALALLGLSTALPGVLVDHMTHQDLAVQAARSAWPDPGGADERERDAARFLSIQWSWQFAAPWAHWRILAQRVRGGGDSFDARGLFGVDTDLALVPAHDRERGWRHFAWVDLHQRLNGPIWIGPSVCGLLLLLAALALRRARRADLVPAPG